MATIVQTVGTALGSKLVKDTLETSAQNVAPSSANVTSAAGDLLMIQIDNSANSHEIYYKLANATSTTIGTTEPNLKVRVPAGGSQSIVFADANAQTGITFSSGFSQWVVKEADKTGTTGPDAAVVVYLLVA